jgi:hypothetical protein
MNAGDLFFFDRDELDERSRALRAGYVTARPYPHVVLDDLLPARVAAAVEGEFSPPDAPAWLSYRRGIERRFTLRDESRMGPHTRHLFAELRGSVFLRFLEALTGIAGLIPSPHHEDGGGLYQSEPGCLLRVHADFNRDERLGLDRRVNLLLYLNEEWRDDYGGELELWSADMARCEQRIAPRFNRCVIFATNDTTYHGHPEPLRCPPGRTRKSLAMYYFTNGRPAAEVSTAHAATFQRRPQDPPLSRMRAPLRRWLPPVVFDLGRRLWARR